MKEVDLSNPDVVRYVVKRFGLRMNKKLGQNFLIRHAVVDDIADAAGIGEGDPVLEIGPGIGTLTQALAETGGRCDGCRTGRSSAAGPRQDAGTL